MNQINFQRNYEDYLKTHPKILVWKTAMTDPAVLADALRISILLKKRVQCSGITSFRETNGTRCC